MAESTGRKEQAAPGPDTGPAPSPTTGEPEAKAPDPVRRWTGIVLVLCVLLFVWYLAADRHAPWTDQARVHGFVIAIAPKVAGFVQRVNVSQDQVVKEGELLVQIDPRDYELAVQRAEAALELAGQDIGAGTDQVAIAQAKLTEARTQRDFVDVQARRYLELAKKGTISKADADRATAELKKAEAQVASAQADLDKAKEQLGAKGQENARIRDAIAALEKARRDLGATSLVAPMEGGIANLQVQEGYYATAGQPMMTFVSARDVWIQANLRENSIGNVKVGDPVEIALDVAPGRIFSGTVTSLGFAVDQSSSGEMGEAVTIEGGSGWLRDAQRFPVVIDFADDSATGYRRRGGQADVQIYTGTSNALLNGLGWAWIRLMSLLSYVY